MVPSPKGLGPVSGRHDHPPSSCGLMGVSFSTMSNLATITLTGLEPAVQVGDNGEGGTVTLEQFVAGATVSNESPRSARFTYQVGGETRQVNLTLVDAYLTQSGTLTLTALLPNEVADQNESFTEAEFRVGEATALVGPPIGGVQGTVTDENGNPLEGVEVVAASIQTLRTFTDENGYYRLLSFEGPYSFGAGLQGYEPYFVEIVFFFPYVLTPIDITLRRS